MITSFEATVLGFIAENPGSRYDIMTTLNRRSLYWSGSAGAVYSAVERLVKKGFVVEVSSNEPKQYLASPSGVNALIRFLIAPVTARKLISDPSLLRLKLRGVNNFPLADRITFYQKQLEELQKAKNLIAATRTGTFGEEISEQISDLAIEVLQVEEKFVQKLLDQDLIQ